MKLKGPNLQDLYYKNSYCKIASVKQKAILPIEHKLTCTVSCILFLFLEIIIAKYSPYKNSLNF